MIWVDRKRLVPGRDRAIEILFLKRGDPNAVIDVGRLVLGRHQKYLGARVPGIDGDRESKRFKRLFRPVRGLEIELPGSHRLTAGLCGIGGSESFGIAGIRGGEDYRLRCIRIDPGGFGFLDSVIKTSRADGLSNDGPGVARYGGAWWHRGRGCRRRRSRWRRRHGARLLLHGSPHGLRGQGLRRPRNTDVLPEGDPRWVLDVVVAGQTVETQHVAEVNARKRGQGLVTAQLHGEIVGRIEGLDRRFDLGEQILGGRAVWHFDEVGLEFDSGASRVALLQLIDRELEALARAKARGRLQDWCSRRDRLRG